MKSASQPAVRPAHPPRPLAAQQVITTYQSNESWLHVFVFDGFTLADTIGDVEMDELSWKVYRCGQSVNNLHWMQWHLHVHQHWEIPIGCWHISSLLKKNQL